LELTIEEAVQRVKAEIIAPDWRLNARRIESLAEAFSCLEKRFPNRKGLKAILTMAGNVLQYIKVHGDHSPPDSIDFLKEAMADVVNLYEDVNYDPEQEKRLFKKDFAHFQRLKEKIKSHRNRRPSGQNAADRVGQERVVRLAQAESPESKDEEPQMVREPASEKDHPGNPASTEAADLLADLNRTLQQAEEVGAVLQNLLQAAAPLRKGLLQVSPAPVLPAKQPAAAADQGRSTPPDAGTRTEYVKCPPTDLREIIIEDRCIGLPEEAIAMIRPLASASREKYLREGLVPLGDFTRLFSSLSGQFEGMLASIPDRKLKKLVLPVISFRTVGMPELPDAQATTLLVLSFGHWHGVLFCSGVGKELRTMVKIRKAANGDIVGIGILKDGGELPVANVADLLRREGFLAIV
jgi:hypothetical protein